MEVGAEAFPGPLCSLGGLIDTPHLLLFLFCERIHVEGVRRLVASSAPEAAGRIIRQDGLFGAIQVWSELRFSSRYLIDMRHHSASDLLP